MTEDASVAKFVRADYRAFAVDHLLRRQLVPTDRDLVTAYWGKAISTDERLYQSALEDIFIDATRIMSDDKEIATLDVGLGNTTEVRLAHRSRIAEAKKYLSVKGYSLVERGPEYVAPKPKKQ